METAGAVMCPYPLLVPPLSQGKPIEWKLVDLSAAPETAAVNSPLAGETN